MAHTYLLPIKTAAVLFPLLALLLLLPTAVVLYRRHGVLTSGRFLSLSAFGHYALTAACMTVVPLPSRTVDVCAAYAETASPQLVPGNTLGDIWKEAHHRIGLGPLLLHNPAVAGAVFNLLLLLPLGVFLRYHFRRGLAATACAGAGLSLAFELTQFTGVLGLYPCPYRLFDVDDLLINTSGAVLGWALTGPAVRLLPALETLDGRALSRVPVPLGRRLTALLADLIGVSFTTLCCVLVAAYTGDGEDEATLLLTVLVAVCAVWFVALPYATGATPGKRLLRLSLVGERGGPAPVWRLAVRAAALGGLVLPLFSLLSAAAVVLVAAVATPTARQSTVAVAESARTADLADAAALASRLSGESLLLAALACCCALLPLTLLWHPRGLGPHERLSGVRNAALPPTRATGAAGAAGQRATRRTGPRGASAHAGRPAVVPVRLAGPDPRTGPPPVHPALQLGAVRRQSGPVSPAVTDPPTPLRGVPSPRRTAVTTPAPPFPPAPPRSGISAGPGSAAE